MKRIMTFFLLIICCFSFGLTKTSAADLNRKILRIGLHYGSGALDTANLQNVTGAGYALGYMNGYDFVSVKNLSQQKISIKTSNGSYHVIDTDTGAALYDYTGDHLAIRPNSELTWCKGYQYYGDFVYRADNNKVSEINYVTLEDYVKGVLPYEISTSWNVEAQKAQAIAARSYALGNLNKHQSLGFDLCNTTNCQVYRGASKATATSDAAVDATRGEYLSYNGELVTGFFFSSDGGATEDARNVWGTDYPYYKGVLDPYEDIENAYNGVWSVTLTPAEIAAKLNAAGKPIGTVNNVQVTNRTAMDNVNEVTITDADGTTVVISRSACRTVLGLNSIRYRITGGATASDTVYVNGSAVSAGSMYAIGAGETKKSVGKVSGRVALTGEGKQTIVLSEGGAAGGDSFTFNGTGWGHSVGLSQYGAKGMAEAGYTYDKILQYFYTDITIADQSAEGDIEG